MEENADNFENYDVPDDNSETSTDPPDFNDFKERLRKKYDISVVNVKGKENESAAEEIPDVKENESAAEERSLSSWGSDFSEIPDVKENEKGETFVIGEEQKEKYRRRINVRSTVDFFENILELDSLYITDKEFINSLLDRNVFSIKREFSKTMIITDYSIKLFGGEFKTIGRVMTLEETDFVRGSIMDEYDDFRKKRLIRKIKKGGVITAIGLSIIGLVTGLSVGLRRKGNDLIHHAAASKWEKLVPAKKTTKEIIPWTELTDATGRTLVFTGRYLTVILTVTGTYLLFSGSNRKRKPVR